MRTKFLLMIGLVLTMWVVGAHAEIITYELPSAFEREYNDDDHYLAMDFDLGVTFTDIWNVYIDWSGEITGALLVHTNDPGGEPFSLDVGIYSYLGSSRYTELWGGGTSYPDPELFDLQNEFESLTGPTDWSDLLDGQGTITIGYDRYIRLFDTYIEHGHVVLNNASLVVEGVAVPEPATVLLFGVGAIIFRSF